jgi:hypothetical protein
VYDTSFITAKRGNLMVLQVPSTHAHSSLQGNALRNEDSKEIISAVKSNAPDSILIVKLERLKYDFHSVTT